MHFINFQDKLPRIRCFDMPEPKYTTEGVNNCHEIMEKYFKRTCHD